MATTYRTLGQIASTGTIGTYDTLYTVNSPVTGTIVSNIVVCNLTASAQYVRLACSNVTSPARKDFIAYGVTVPANDTIPLVIGVTLDSTVKYLLCSSTSASVSFSAFGAEITS